MKYHNTAISTSYKQIEHESCERLLDKLPEDLRAPYRNSLDHETEREQARLIKAADKLCALIKCITERRRGNHEFDKAYETTLTSVKKLSADCEELDWFLKHLADGFEKTLDELG